MSDHYNDYFLNSIDFLAKRIGLNKEITFDDVKNIPLNVINIQRFDDSLTISLKTASLCDYDLFNKYDINVYAIIPRSDFSIDSSDECPITIHKLLKNNITVQVTINFEPLLSCFSPQYQQQGMLYTPSVLENIVAGSVMSS